MARAGGTAERPATFFDGPQDLRAWFAANHSSARELWLGLTKRHVTTSSLTYHEALQEALCYGWIDSVAQRIDEDTRRQRWTPRRRGSVWSAVNIALVERLTAEGRMQPSGLAAFQARLQHRSGIYSYEQPGGATLPPEYAGQLASDPRAAAFWAGATPSYRRIATHWVLSAAQQATRERRMGQLVSDCAAGVLIKPQRYGTEPAWVARLRAQLQP